MISRRVSVVAAAAVAALLVAVQPALGPGGAALAQGRPEAPPALGRPEVSDEEILVAFKPGTPAAEHAAAHARAGGQVVREVAGLGIKVVRVPRGRVQERLPAYHGNPNVAYAEPNGIAYVSTADPLYGQQWNLNNPTSTAQLDPDIDAPQAWSKTRGAGSVKIAILDTGVKDDHPDLQGKVVSKHDWAYNETWDPVDNHGHGTHVAGIAGARTDNNAGIAGVCPDCALINGRVCFDDGSCPHDRMANGILWAVGCDQVRPNDPNCYGEHGPVANGGKGIARAINLSIAGRLSTITLQSAVNKAWEKGAVLACAAGNDNSNRAYYPAAYGNCIAVAATDSQNKKASFSNYGGSWVDVAAPGVGIWSSTKDGQYAAWNGTSMATPQVAGLAGLLASQGKGRDAVRTAIESTVDKLSGTGAYWSKGRINACRAVGATGC
jgi:thermitase